MVVAFMMFIKELRKKGGEIAATAENRHCRRLGKFLKKNKLGSNNSEMYNSARNGKKKFGGRWRFSAVSPPFLRSSLINIIKATATPKLTAATHFLAEPPRQFQWFQKVAHPPPPFKMKTSAVQKSVYIANESVEALHT